MMKLHLLGAPRVAEGIGKAREYAIYMTLPLHSGNAPVDHELVLRQP